MKYRDFLKLLDINTVKGAYLLHGEDEFFKEACLRSCEELIPAESRVFDLRVLHDADRDSIMEACEMLPLLSPACVVVVKGLASGADCKELAEYLENLPDTTALFIGVRGELESKSKLLGFFSRNGGEVLFDKPNEAEAAAWCVVTASRRGTSIDRSVASILVGLVGTDMVRLSNELQKAIDRVGEDGVITADIISSSAIGNIEFKVFDAINCLTSAKPADGIRALHALLSEKDDQPIIIGALLSNFRRMLEGRRLMDTGLSVKAAAAKLPGKSYPNEKACAAAKKYTAKSLSALISALSLALYKERSGGSDAAESVEIALCAFNW
ncbi:MAG: DNA polymerase III subunit delta [Clostridia bacterium]|nr:DNA polymerase III subunit delta [Clostridia bacterium]